MVVILILLAAASRLLPHPPNFAPVAAIGLFAGATLDKRAAWLVPFAALVISDAFLGFYLPIAMFMNYLGFAACLLVGAALLKQQRGIGRIAAASVTSALAFFVLSNLGMWLSGYYPRTGAGLVECYTAAIPFFRNTLVSDLLFSGALFGGYALLKAVAARLRRSAATA